MSVSPDAIRELVTGAVVLAVLIPAFAVVLMVGLTRR